MQKVIVTWEDLRSEIRLLFTHEGLGEDLAGRFAVFMDEEVHDPAVVSIDKFCLSHPKNSPADGAIAYLNALIEN